MQIYFIIEFSILYTNELLIILTKPRRVIIEVLELVLLSGCLLFRSMSVT